MSVCLNVDLSLLLPEKVLVLVLAGSPPPPYRSREMAATLAAAALSSSSNSPPTDCDFPFLVGELVGKLKDVFFDKGGLG